MPSDPERSAAGFAAMGPIATKLLRELRKARRSMMADLSALREARGLVAGLESIDGIDELPINHARWMHIFKALAGLANAVLGTSALRKLALRVEAAEDEYMPDGPPDSPVLDSVFMSWWMADLSVGPRRESVLSVLADAGPVLGLPSEFCAAARTLAQSRMGVYRVSEVAADRVRLTELSTGSAVQAHLPSDLRARGELWLTRLLPPPGSHGGDWVVWTTPYVLEGTGAVQEWEAYCERAVAGGEPAQRSERLARHFKAADDPRRWLEYIMNGYAGVDDVGSILLCGVPDRPETLPHHPAYERAAVEALRDATPIMRVRHRLVEVAREHPFIESEDEASLRRKFGAPTEPANPGVRDLLALAYAMYGQLDADGNSPVELLIQRGAELPADERGILAALSAGWFSAFEILRVRVDEGMELRDVLRRRTIWVSERSATRQVDLGDLLGGWVMDEGGRYTLEGAICHVPRVFAEPFAGVLRDLRDGLARAYPRLGWKKRAGLLAPYLVPLLDAVYARAPLPSLHNTDGHEILISTAHYRVRDAKLVAGRLGERFEPDGDRAYRLVTGDALSAQLELDGDILTVRCNSRERLDATKELLARALGELVVHRADSHEDPCALLKRGPDSDRGEDGQDEDDADVLPAEMSAQAQAMLLARMRKWIDEPVPLLGGKTPRQATRSARGRDDVTLLLTRQQQLFDSGAGLAPIDLGEIWAELGLRPPS